MDIPFRAEVQFTDENLDKVITTLEEAGGTGVRQIKQWGLTGIEIVIVVTLVAPTLANLVIKLTSLWKCGVVVDIRGQTVLTQKNCDLPRGNVLIISSDGTKSELHQPTEIDIQAAIKAAVANKP